MSNLRDAIAINSDIMIDDEIRKIKESFLAGEIKYRSPLYNEETWGEVLRNLRKDKAINPNKEASEYEVNGKGELESVQVTTGHRVKDITPSPHEIYSMGYGFPKDKSKVMIILLNGDIKLCTFHENFIDYRKRDNENVFVNLIRPSARYIYEEVVWWSGIPSYIKTLSEWTTYGEGESIFNIDESNDNKLPRL